MLESMTAYGSAEIDINNNHLTIEIKSVNHRFFEARLKMPYSMGKIDPAIRKLLKEKLVRGSVDCYIKTTKISKDETNCIESITVDTDLLSQYIKALEEIKVKFNISDNIKISDVLKIPNLFINEEKSFSDEELEKKILKTIEKCLGQVLEMQKKEGAELKKVIDKNLDIIDDYVVKIKDGSKDLLNNSFIKIKDNLTKLLSSSDISEDRILTEAGILAEHIDVTEEIDRLNSHIKQLRYELNNNTDVGRKLDFIIQEVNREINTIASKSEEKDVIYHCVETKSIIEKIREQVQNVK
ncbi:MAG: YicC/YloC family endoribonuclease [bacterium]